MFSALRLAIRRSNLSALLARRRIVIALASSKSRKNPEAAADLIETERPSTGPTRHTTRRRRRRSCRPRRTSRRHTYVRAPETPDPAWNSQVPRQLAIEAGNRNHCRRSTAAATLCELTTNYRHWLCIPPYHTYRLLSAADQFTIAMLTYNIHADIHILLFIYAFHTLFNAFQVRGSCRSLCLHALCTNP